MYRFWGVRWCSSRRCSFLPYRRLRRRWRLFCGDHGVPHDWCRERWTGRTWQSRFPVRVFFEMPLFERFIVRPVAERIEHGPYFHAFFTFSASRSNSALAIESLRKLKYSRWMWCLASRMALNKSMNFSRPLFSNLTLLLSDIGIPDSDKKRNTRESLVRAMESLGCVIKLSMTSAWARNKDRNRNKRNIRSFKTLLAILVYKVTKIQHLCLELSGEEGKFIIL